MTGLNGPDPLSALAPLFRVTPELQALCGFGAQWASPHAQEPANWAPFHLVTAGRCVLELDGQQPVPLGAGDIALMPFGAPHVVRGEGTPAGLRHVPGLTRRRGEVLEFRGNGVQPEAELICGRLRFAAPHDNVARLVLPELIVLRTDDEPDVARLRDLLLLIRRELDGAGPGSRAVCGDLASALLMMVLRIYFRRGGNHPGLLRLLSQASSARAVTALLGDPTRRWSLDDLASAARCSRATLVRDFRRLAGTSPLAFLTDLRLRQARQMLTGSTRSLAEIAESAGYESASAFTRAFQRAFRQSPTDVRRGPARMPDGLNGEPLPARA